ncbi:SURF1 family protein [Sphingomonas sinipercae]|uniref:SURF1-like protein n=1 Tax=Sphingomonas sinipercae TaxID=2714944 RepID=A0A6G7ZK96_9SPHN|nr:SURF1 family protein [Sphingomonas sinipercae]QIL01349.1 SURF1 family protein [Sphingomonas sinipercae]
MKRIPIFATLLVAAAVATMIALGIWQLGRAQWKDRLLADYGNAGSLPPIAYPVAKTGPLLLYRRANAVCAKVVGQRAVAGENRRGDPGYAHVVDCARAQGQQPLSVELGWSRDPNASFDWAGGAVAGVIAPDRKQSMRLVADHAPSGLEPSAVPSAASIPNNHRSYAIQWFAFALIALVIYGIALRRRLRG